ncbi:MAG: hypothetical protein ACQEST_01400 [Bacteroidota bacterium]
MQHSSPTELFKQYLYQKDITPEEFAGISGMPLTEVMGLLEGELPVTTLRAYHLAAAFDTDVEMWLNDAQNTNRKNVPA